MLALALVIFAGARAQSQGLSRLPPVEDAPSLGQNIGEVRQPVREPETTIATTENPALMSLDDQVRTAVHTG